MKRINNILLVVGDNDDSQAFVGEAIAVAKGAEAQVTLLSIIDTPNHQEREAELSNLERWKMEDQQDKMNKVFDELVKNGIQVTIKQASGKHYLEIIREAIRENYDLIMKPAEIESTVKTVLFGSTDMQLFRLCPYPVWAFKPTTNTELRKVMVAVDLLAYDKEKSALADKVLQWGKQAASLAGSELHVIHIWELYGESILRGRSILANAVDKLVEDEEDKQRRWLNEALAKNEIEKNKIQIHFYKGEAKKLIPEIITAMKADLLVMGTVGRTGIPGFFIGNTADSILRQVNCSVLAIKPEGFSTPVV